MGLVARFLFSFRFRFWEQSHEANDFFLLFISLRNDAFSSNRRARLDPILTGFSGEI